MKKNAVNGVINKITEIVTLTKLKELKQYVKNVLPNYKK